MSALVQRVRDAVCAEASTRPVAIVRIALALVVWARLASDLAFFQDRPWTWGALGASLYVSSTLLLLGWRSRLAAAWTAANIATLTLYFGVVQRHHALIHHHVTLLMIAVGLLALTPCGRSLSVDRWRALRSAERDGRAPPPERGPVWGATLIAIQLSAVYFWSAVDKSKGAWLSGERLEQILMFVYTGSDRPAFRGFSALCTAGAIATVVVEYALAFGLWFRRTRGPLLVTAFLFHGALYFTLPVQTFTVTMYAMLLLFVPPEVIHAAVDRMVGRR